MLYWDLKLYLPGDLLTVTDRMSMRHSLEVRVPYLDHVVLELFARMPPKLKLRGLEKKYLLKQIAYKLLPHDIINRPKKGFSVPLAVWFRGELREYVEDSLAVDRLARSGAFNASFVRRILDDHFAHVANYDNVIWALLVFELWHAEYIEGDAGAS